MGVKFTFSKKHQSPVLSKSEQKCAAKKGYESKRIAGIRAEQIGPKRGEVLFSYRCPECKKWHLTRRLQHEGQTTVGYAPTLEGFKKEPDA